MMRLEPSSGDDGGPFSILCVCTGNVCRSPAAERLLAARLGEAVSVSSAGTHALIGKPVSPPMARLIADAGAEPRGFSARLINEALVRRADLILAMAHDHKAMIAEEWPAAVRRLFTLKELQRLLGEIDTERLPTGPVDVRLRSAIPLATAQRRRVDDPSLDDVTDPYGRSDETYLRAFTDIDRAVDRIARVVAPDRDRPPEPRRVDHGSVDLR